MAEAELARNAAVAAARYAEPRRTGTPHRQHLPPEISINGLGRSECVVSIGSRTLRLSPRHSEIMVILAACPGGLTGDELAYMLYPADGASSTPRAELVRMRALLGERVLASRPYRLTCDVMSDWAAVGAQVAAGNLAEALRLYRGPLLPRSESPGVAELRADLDCGRSPPRPRPSSTPSSAAEARFRGPVRALDGRGTGAGRARNASS
jgi:hypothetical protein